MNKTFSSFLLLLFFCAPQSSSAKVYSKAFANDYDRVWKGILISLSKYPLDRNDQEAGEITTALIKPGEAFQIYEESYRPREQYQLFIQAQKLIVKGRKIVQVKVEKKSFIKGDFMQKEKEIPSNGIEENVLLYRILREVKIDKTIDKFFK